MLKRRDKRGGLRLEESLRRHLGGVGLRRLVTEVLGQEGFRVPASEWMDIFFPFGLTGVSGSKYIGLCLTFERRRERPSGCGIYCLDNIARPSPSFP